jgi:hypothetical protein
MMEAVLRVIVCLALVVALTAGAAQVNPETLTDYVHEVYNLPVNFVRTQYAKKQGVELAAQREAIRDRIEQKDRIARDVVEGRLALREAADRFYEVSKGAPYVWDLYKEKHPEWPLEVRCAHLVIDEVEVILRDKQQESSSVIEPLREEVASW